jgi:hypothetical protein
VKCFSHSDNSEKSAPDWMSVRGGGGGGGRKKIKTANYITNHSYSPFSRLTLLGNFVYG